MIEDSKKQVLFSLGKTLLKYLLGITIVTTILYPYLKFSLYAPFHDNEGYTLWCTFKHELIELIHPGKDYIRGCTYDHQPLYYFILKPFSFLINYESNYFFLRLINFGFLIGSFFLFLRILKSKTHSSLFIMLIFLLTFLNIQLISQLIIVRMYGLFFFTSLLQIYLYQKAKSNKDLRVFLFVSILASFNFYASHILTFLLLVDFFWKKDRNFIFSSLKRHALTFYFLFLAFIYKLPYLVEHRIFLRGPHNYQYNSTLSHFFDKLFAPLFNITSKECFFVITVLLMDSLIFRRKKVSISIFLGMGSVIFGFFILMYGFNVEEIEARYFLYFLPLLFIFIISENRHPKAPMIYFLLVLFTCTQIRANTLDQLDRLLKGIWATRSTIVDQQLIQLHQKYKYEETCVLESYDQYFHYLSVYSYLEGKIERPFTSCKTFQSKPKFILSHDLYKDRTYIKSLGTTVKTEYVEQIKTDFIETTFNVSKVMDWKED